jgi:WD40 repeat protein
LKVWDVASGQQIWSDASKGDNVGESYKHPLAISPDGKMLVEAIYVDVATAKNNPTRDHLLFPIPRDMEIKLRDAHTGRELKTLVRDSGAPENIGRLSGGCGWTTVAFSPDGTLIAAVGGALSSYQDDGHCGTVYLWDVATGRLKWKGHKRNIKPTIIAFSPDGSLLACGCRILRRANNFPGGEVMLWNVKNGKLRRTLTRETLADKVRYAVEVNIQKLNNYRASEDAAAHQRLASDYSSPVTAIAFSPDGTLLAAGDQEGIVKIWNTSGASR